MISGPAEASALPPDAAKGVVRERLSSQGTFYYRSISPFVALAITVAGAGAVAWAGWTARDPLTLAIVAFIPLFSVVVYLAWRGRSLCDVWLVGDALDVKGPTGLARVPLASVHLIDGGSRWTLPRTVTLWLDRPVDGLREVRFMPRGSAAIAWPDLSLRGFDAADELVADLRARVARERSPQTSL
jgi:hypothetical protein